MPTNFTISLALAGLLVLGALTGAGGLYLLGRGHGAAANEQKHQAALAEHLQRGIEQATKLAREDAEISEFYERWRTRTIAKVSVEEVTREIPADCLKCGLGPDGLRLINEARGYDSPAASSPKQPDGGVPATPGNGIGSDQGFGRGVIPLQFRLLRLCREAQLTDQADQSARGGI